MGRGASDTEAQSSSRAEAEGLPQSADDLRVQLTLAWLSGSSGAEEAVHPHLDKAIRITAQSSAWFPPYAQATLRAFTSGVLKP